MPMVAGSYNNPHNKKGVATRPSYDPFANVHMIIKVLGSGCSACKKLEANTQKAVKALGLAASIEKVEDFEKIMAYGVMSTPALVIDEEVKLYGKVASPKEIISILEKL